MKQFIVTSTIISTTAKINNIKTAAFNNYNDAKEVFTDIIECYREEIQHINVTIEEENQYIVNDTNEIYFTTIKFNADNVTTKLIVSLSDITNATQF